MQALAEVDGYLAHVWPQVAASVDTAGFLGSALYMADMALDAVEAVEAEYEPVVYAGAARRAGLRYDELDATRSGARRLPFGAAAAAAAVRGAG